MTRPGRVVTAEIRVKARSGSPSGHGRNSEYCRERAGTEAGEDQEIAAAAGDTALNRLKDGGMAHIALQQIASSQRAIKNDSEEARWRRQTRAGSPSAGRKHPAGDHQQAAGDQTQGGNDKQRSIDQISPGALMAEGVLKQMQVSQQIGRPTRWLITASVKPAREVPALYQWPDDGFFS